MTRQLEQELADLLNRYSVENGSDTPDFILAQYLVRCIANFNATTKARENYYGRRTTVDAMATLDKAGRAP